MSDIEIVITFQQRYKIILLMILSLSTDVTMIYSNPA